MLNPPHHPTIKFEQQERIDNAARYGRRAPRPVRRSPFALLAVRLSIARLSVTRRARSLRIRLRQA